MCLLTPDAKPVKIVLLGDPHCGKAQFASLVRAAAGAPAEDGEPYRGAQGVVVATAVIDDVPHRLWDAPGSDVGTLGHADNRIYMRGADGAIVFCDPARSETVANAEHWADAFERECPGAPIFRMETAPAAAARTASESKTIAVNSVEEAAAARSNQAMAHLVAVSGFLAQCQRPAAAL